MPVDLVQRGPFSYDELTVTANQAGASPSAPRDFTLTNAIFDSTIGEVLEVFVNGVKLVGSGLNATGDEFTVDGNISKITIVADSALNSAGDSTVTTLAEGDTVLIRRVSNRTAKKVDFAPGSVIREADLDNANTQVFHTAQEAIDIALQGMVLGADGKWNAESGGANRKIKNVLDPGDPQDVATKAYVDGQSATTTVAAIQDQIVTVAGVSNDVTTVAGAVAETITYTVTVSNSKFFLNGGEFSSATTNPVLNLQRGSTYKFNYSDSSVSSGSHALGFSSTDSNTAFSGATAYTTGVTDDTVNKIITLVVDASAPNTLYYYCTNSSHNAMGNTMNIAEDSIEIVADNIANVNKVAAIDSNVTTVAGIDSNVTTVAGIHGNVTTVAGIGTNGADVTTVAGKATEISTLVNGTDGTSGTSGSTNNLALINTVEGSISNVNTVATNINHVNNFNDTYHTPSSTAPTGSNVTEGDLWFDTANGVLKVYDGSSWGSATSSISSVASTSEFTASDGQGTDSKYFAINHDVGLELVFLNGVRLKRGSDYYCTNSNTSTTPIATSNAATFVRLETVPGSSDILSIMAFGQIANNLAVNTAGGTFTGGVTFEAGTTHNLTSNNTSFTLPTTRGTDNYVLTRDDTAGTGGTAWKETIVPPTISSITYPTQNGVQSTALAATGAQDTTAETLLINGENLGTVSDVPVVQIQVSGTYETFAGTVSCNAFGTVVTCANVTKQASADNYTLRLTHGSNSQTVTTTVNFSADPSFSTASGSLGNVYAGVSTSKTITAGSSVSWYEGATTFPSWMVHFADGATGTSQDLTGTPTNSGTSPEIQNFNIIIRDSENQSHNRDFSLTVNDLPIASGGITPTTPTIGGIQYALYQFTTVGASTLTVYHTITDVEYVLIGGGGEGGQGHSPYAVGSAGGESYFKVQGASSNLIHCAGGGGGRAHGQNASANGGSGGGGGGGNGTSTTPPYNIGGTGISNEGNDGGDSSGAQGPYVGGGGGGAGHAGQDGYSTVNGAGGIGITSSITGSAVGRAGGGGAGGWHWNSETWNYGGAWNGSNTSAGTGSQGQDNQSYGAGNGAQAGGVASSGNPQAGGNAGANTGSGGGAGDSGSGAGHGGGGAGGYRSSVTGEATGGGGTLESKLTLNAGTYDVQIGAGGTGSTYGGDGGSGVLILRFPI